MNLGWVHDVGLLSPRADTAVLAHYPLPVKRQVVESVIGFFHTQYTEAAATLLDLAHVKWVLECSACACALPLPAGEEAIGWVIELYRDWLLNSARRPAVVQAHLAFVRSEMIRHLSLVFEPRGPPHSLPREQAREAHHRLSMRVLALYAALGQPVVEDFPVGTRVRAGPSDARSKEVSEGLVISFNDGMVLVGVDTGPSIGPLTVRPEELRRCTAEGEMDPQLTADENWEVLVKTLIGVVDFLLSNAEGQRELLYPAVSVLLETLLRSRLRDDALWDTMSDFASRWSAHAPCVTQWAAALHALTLAALPALRHAAGEPLSAVLGRGCTARVVIVWERIPPAFRRVSELDFSWEHLLVVWRRFYHLLGDFSEITDPRVYSSAMGGVRDAVLLLSRAGWFEDPLAAPYTVADAALRRQYEARLVPPHVAAAAARHALQQRGVKYPLPSCDAKGLMDLFGDALLGAVFQPRTQQAQARDGGRAIAYGALCDIFLRPHPGSCAQQPELLRVFYAAALAALEEAAAGAEEGAAGDGGALLGAVLSNTCMLLAHDLPGALCVAPSLMALISSVLLGSWGQDRPGPGPAASDKSGGSSGGASPRLDSPSATVLTPAASPKDEHFGGVEDYDTDDELEHRAQQLCAAGKMRLPGSEASPSPSPCSSPAASPRARLQSPVPRFPTSPAEAQHPDGHQADVRRLALLALSTVAALPPQGGTGDAQQGVRPAEVRRVLTRGLSAERDPTNLQLLLSICTQYAHAELARALPAAADAQGGGEEEGPLSASARGAAGAAGQFTSHAVRILEGAQSPGASARQSADLYLACVALLQQLALPFCSRTAAWPPPGHPTRRALSRVDPALAGRAAGALARFVLYLHDSHFGGGRHKASHAGLAERDVGRLCTCALDALHEWVSACPEALAEGAQLRQVLHAVDAAATMASAEAPSLQAAAVRVWRAALTKPFAPLKGSAASAAVSSGVTEAALAAGATQSVRWFAVDGGRILSLVEHGPCEGAAGSARVAAGGVSVILRDAFGRFAWDARLRLSPDPDDAVQKLRPVNASFTRRQAVAFEVPEGAEGVGASLAALLAPLQRSAGAPDLTSREAQVAALLSDPAPHQPARAAPPAEPPAEVVPDASQAALSRRLLQHTRLAAPGGQRAVELLDTPELHAGLAMLDATPEREAHRVSVLYVHSYAGTAELRRRGVEWYLPDPAAAPPSAELPTLGRFADFMAGLGWAVDPAAHPGAYTGGAAAQRWRRQRLPYYADSRCELVWTVSSAPLADLDRVRGGGHGGIPWEDRTPVRVVWNDSRREYNPSATDSEPARQLRRATDGVWQPRQAAHLDLVLQPLQGGMVAVRVVLPVADERWGGEALSQDAFAPGVWHAPLVDGAVIPAAALPALVRAACLQGSRAFREHPPSRADAQRRRASGPPLQSRMTYLSPTVTRGLILHRLCCRLPTVAGTVPPPAIAPQSRVLCLRTVHLGGGRAVRAGDRGTVRSVDCAGGKETLSVAFDALGGTATVDPADVSHEPAVATPWGQWRLSTRCAATDLLSLLQTGPPAEP